MSIEWRNATARLGDLKPWAHNPRMSTKAQAKRLLASWKDLGQFQTIAVGPEWEVYDGHQRLSALLTVYGPEYVVDVRQAARPLTEEERQKLVITAHVGAVGSWNWDALSGWDAGRLGEWGMDADALRTWNLDALNLREMIGVDDPNKEWEGMPEYVSGDETPLRSIKVHFYSKEDVDAFSRLIDQTITDKTISLNFPYRERENLADKVYVSK